VITPTPTEETIPLDLIDVGDRLRKPDLAKIEELAASMAKHGLLQRIGVRERVDENHEIDYELIWAATARGGRQAPVVRDRRQGLSAGHARGAAQDPRDCREPAPAGADRRAAGQAEGFVVRGVQGRRGTNSG
jgi:hypothetical protein